MVEKYQLNPGAYKPYRASASGPGDCPEHSGMLAALVAGQPGGEACRSAAVSVQWVGQIEELAGSSSRRRDCHFADTPLSL